MNLSIALIRSFLLLLPAFLIFSGIPMVAVADNNVDALQNIIRAEKLFELEDDKNALLLLKKALRDQRTNGKEYGYARYIHYRLAKHYHSKGQKARAKQELNRALKIDTSKYVKHHYQVSTSDPLIVSYFPRFHSRKSFRVKKNRYYMGVRWLSNCNSPTIFGMSRDSILSIDRQKRKITEILSENGTGSCAPPSYKYAFKGPSCIGIKSEDCSRHLINVVISKENMHFFASTPFFHQKRHLPSRNKKFFLDSNFENLVEYTNSPCRVRMHSPLKNSGSGYRSFRPDGDCLGMNYNHAIWGSYNDDRHRRIVGTPDYKRFVAHDFRDDSSIVLYEFKRPTFSNHTAIITSDDISSVFFEDEFRKKSFLLLHDWKTKTTKTVQFPYMDFLTSREKQIRYLLNTARFSVSENYYLIAALRKKHLIIFRVDLASDDLERIDLGPIAPFSGSHAWYKLRGFGFLKDKSSFWFQFDNVLLIIDNQFKSYKVDLSPYSLKESKWIQWVHGTRFYTNPDEFYFSAEGKPGLYKIRISLAEALRHAQPAVETPSPEIVRVDPHSFGASSAVTIVGKNFSLLDIPYVDNLPLRNVSVTSDSIKGVIPSGIRKAGVIRLRRKKVTVASTKKFDFVKKPIIRSVSPKSARPGEEVTIKGKFLDNVSQIFIDDIPQEMLNCSAKSVSFVVSPTSTTGILGIKTPGGQATLKRPYKVIK